MAAAVRARRALDILGADTPEHLQEAARLRIDNPEAPLSRLGLMAALPLSKDRMRSRPRTLFDLADRRAAELGVPGTEETLLAGVRSPT
jgi:DNA-binding transcriptional regulator WhiA